jgi:hypothetical protein
VRVTLTALILVFLFSGSYILAQSPNASITGIVLDPDAKSIPGAEVIVVNDVTGVKYVTSTSRDGIYAVENLPPGPYRIQVSKFGFQGIIKPDIILNVQDELSLNFTLPVGAASVTVTVEGGVPMINTTDASVSTVVDRQFAENLPLNGRSFQSLIYLTPGVVVTPANLGDSGQFSVNGQRAASNYWMVDGVSANVGISAGASPGNGMGGTLGSFSATGGTNSLVSVDAMQEFRIQTSTFAPEFGRTPGAQISISTRSGTNQFHGTAFDYVRNDVFDANNWFANENGLKRPEERQNDFGGTLGGPILRNSTFFFFSYEGLRLRLPQTGLSHVPDLSARQAAVPAMQPYLDAYPLPNGTDNLATGTAQFNASYSNPATLDAYSLRLDHKLGNRWSLFARYSYSPSELSVRGLSNGSGALSTVQPSRITGQTITLGGTWVASRSVTNDLRLNLSRTDGRSYDYLDKFGGAVPLSPLPFPASYTTGNAFFGMSIFGLGNGEEIAAGKTGRNVQRQFNVVDNLVWQIGTHTVKAGIDFRRLTPAYDPFAYNQGATFSEVSGATTGASNSVQVLSQNGTTLLFRNLGLYAQDTWRVVPRLSLTYGLRWDIDFAPSSLKGPEIPAVRGYNLRDPSQLAIAPAGTPPFRTTYDNFAPRFGAAYEISQRPNWQRVLRAGFGVFFDLVSSEAGTLVGQGSITPPFGNFINYTRAVFPLSPMQNAPIPIPAAATLASISAYNPDLKLPYTLQWNVTLEQALGIGQTISASYIGAVGKRLLQTTELFNPPANPNLQNGLFVDNTAGSNYNALQVQFKRRLSRGLQVLTSYTWSHSMDDASGGSYFLISNAGVPGSAYGNRGDSDFDIRNSFTAGVTYDVPSLHIRRIANVALGHWSVESLVLVRSAPPIDLSDINFFEFASGTYANVRPDVLPGQPKYLYGIQCASAFQALGALGQGQSCPGGKGLNPAAFTDPPGNTSTGLPSRQGNLGRNVLRGFGASQWDLAIHREFPIHESLKLQFRAEMFNFLNHPNFGPPNGQFGGGSFGLASQTLAQSLASGVSLGAGAFSPLYQIGGPRSMQLALKLMF